MTAVPAPRSMSSLLRRHASPWRRPVTASSPISVPIGARFCPRAGPGALPARARGGAIARRLRPRSLRRPHEHHPLLYRQVSAQLLELCRLPRVLLAQMAVLLRAAQQSAAPAHGSPPGPQPTRPAAMPQHAPNPGHADRSHHTAQQTPSVAEYHAPGPRVTARSARGHQRRATRFPNTCARHPNSSSTGCSGERGNSYGNPSIVRSARHTRMERTSIC